MKMFNVPSMEGDSMSMFSVHYLIRRESDNLYWNGGNPIYQSAWSRTGGIRVFTKSDAEKICQGLLVDFLCIIDEDE